MHNLTETTRREGYPSLDIVIPVYNEETVLPLLFERLESVFSPQALNRHHISRVRYVFVDDGSRDRTADIIHHYIRQGAPASLYRLSRNFGHQNALCAGIHHADADIVSILDADLQDPPEVIFEMIEKWRCGYDVVFGQRRKRKEHFLKVAAYWTFYRILSFLSEIDLPLDSGDFCLMDRRVVDSLKKLPEKLWYTRVLRAWVGFSQIGVEYERSARQAGKTKYPFAKLYKLATDGVASASIRPLRISQVFSVFYLFLASILSIICIFKYWSYRGGSNEWAMWFLFCYILISVGGFVQAFCIYILSSYLGRTYLEVKNRPTYVIIERIHGTSTPGEVRQRGCKP